MTKASEWAKRVRAWQASGQVSREFCAGREFSAKNLLWWSSHFRRHGFPAGTSPSAREVKLARVVTSPRSVGTVGSSVSPSLVVVEVGDARVVVGAGADRATVSMVLDALRCSVGAAGAQ